jgi:ribosomal-protein-alanine N-acetyltransferase
LGTCGFYDWDKSINCCGIIYDLFPDYWGNGYMNEAMKKILAFAKADMKIKQIYACVHIDNENSIKMLEKLGFVFTEQTEVEFITEQKKY